MKRPKTHRKVDGRYTSYYNCPHHLTQTQKAKVLINNWTGKNSRPFLSGISKIANPHLQNKIQCDRAKAKHYIYPANKSDQAYEIERAKKLAKHERELHDKKAAVPNASITLSEVRDKYLEDCYKKEGSKGFSISTNSSRERNSRNYLLQHFPNTQVGKITSKDLIIFYDDLHTHFIQEEKGFDLFLHVQVVTKSIFDYAYNHDYIKANPIDAKVSATATTIYKNIKESYESERGNVDIDLVRNFVDFVLAKASADARFQQLAEFLLVTLHIGTRGSETAGIQLDDIDVKEEEIFIQRQLRRNYKNDKKPIEIVRLKTKNGKRKIPFSTDLKNLFLKIDSMYAEGVLLPDVHGNKSLWQDDAGVPVTRITMDAKLGTFLRTYGAEFKKIYGKAYTYKFHALRHACISTWIIAGVDANTVKLWAGHSSIKTTYDVYGHLIDSQKIKFNMSEHIRRQGDTNEIIFQRQSNTKQISV